MPTGPQKIILINSGKYDFAEIDLAGTLQIVGPNNTGKTTLINTLQFLYINDQREMDFGSYTKEQTRDFYFRNQYSYILFECQSAVGQCVFGWRGSSRASGHDPERFWFQGPYSAEDFFDEKSQVREPRDVSARLAMRQYEKIGTQQQHRELLLNPSAGNRSGLGIISLRDPDKYPHFRETLKNLLSLSTLSQDQMRDRLLMLADIAPEAVAIDARLIFGEDYDRIRSRRDALGRFKQHAAEVAKLVERFKQREAVRGGLIARWTQLRLQRQEFDQRHEQSLLALRTELDAGVEKDRALRAELADRQQQNLELSVQKGGIAERLRDLERRGSEFADFMEPLERAATAATESEVNRLRRAMEDSAAENRDKALQKVQLYTHQVQEKERFIANYGRSVVTALRKRFKDEELDRVFSVLNFDLLELPLGKDGVQVLDEEALLEAVAGILSHTQPGWYADNRVEIALGRRGRSVADISDLEQVRGRLEEERSILDRWRKILQSIQEREKLEQELQAASLRLEEQRKRFVRWEDLQTARAAEPQLYSDLEEVTRGLSRVAEQIRELESRRVQVAETMRRNETGKRSEEDSYNLVMGRFNQCLFPDFAGKAETDLEAPADFDSSIALYLKLQEKQIKLDDEVSDTLRRVEGQLGGDFLGGDDLETLRILQGELEALPDREEALQRDWNAQMHGLKGTFDHVLKEMGEIRTAADQLNRQFSRVQVSNLRSLGVEPREQSDIVSRIRRLAEMEQPSLFDGDTQIESHLNAFRQTLERTPLIRYADLFTLQFRIVTDDDTTRTYNDFRQIESHGTTITIKVLFNLLVLKSLLRRDDCVVPFFLDEIQALDPANRHAILATARQLGFVAITAAPESVTEVDALYFLQPHKGRVVLRHKHKLSVKLSAEGVA